nr:hypothetical protein [Streptomyces tsukubensis NRRL18488]
MTRPQNSPYPDSSPGGVSGQAGGSSSGAPIRERRARGARLKETPDGHEPCASRPARPVDDQTRKSAAAAAPISPAI